MSRGNDLSKQQHMNRLPISMCSSKYGFLSDGKKSRMFAAICGLLLLLFRILMDGIGENIPRNHSSCRDKCVKPPSRCFICFLVLSALSWSALGKDPMTLCSASKHYGSTPPTVIGYPTVMYSGKHVSTSDTYKCSSGDREVKDEKTLTCINTNNSCPVTSENVKTAVGVALWPQYVEAIRRLTETLDRAQDTPMLVNVFFLGGSMTHGDETRCTCYCSSRFDPRCPKEDEDTCSKASVCSWTKHVFKWLVEKYTWVKFTYYDFSGSGLMSQVSVEKYSTWLKHAKAQLSNNDIVFLDHSVNDAALLVYHEDLSQSFELLVRTVLSTHPQQGLVKPTIVVIEQYPHGNPRDGQNGEGPNPSRYMDYARTYREVSKHYGLMLLSLREVYWTYFGMTHRVYSKTPDRKKRMYPISPFSREIHVYVHPPWYIHLFVADVIADSFQHTAHKLKSGLHEDLFLPHSNSSAVLPAPFYKMGNTSSRFASCDTHRPFALDARPTSTFHPANLTAYETDAASVGAAGWREYVDYHNTPGWIINDLSNASLHMLTLPMQGVPSEGMIVKVTHLLSYVGMGMAQLSICGKMALNFPNMDGLNNLFDKVSVPSTFVHSIRRPEAANCMALPPDQRTIGLYYLSHLVTRDLWEVRAKNHYKFKVLEVQVCTPAVIP